MGEKDINIEIVPVGKAYGYEDYRNEYYIGEILVAKSEYNKHQDNGRGLHVGGFEEPFLEKHPKNMYAKTPEGIAWKIKNILTDNYPPMPNKNIEEKVKEGEQRILKKIKFYIEGYGLEALEANGVISSILLSIAEQSRNEVLREAEEAVREYFDGLIHIPYPHKTGESIVSALASLRTNKE